MTTKTGTKTKGKPAKALTSALAKQPSKFEPDPEAYSSKAKKADPKLSALKPTEKTEKPSEKPSVIKLKKPEPEQESASVSEKQPETQPETQPEPQEEPKKEEGSFLELGAGYKMRHRAGSAHSIVTRILAKEGRFTEIVGMLTSETFSPTDKNQANVLLGKMFVLRDSIEDMARADPEFKAHAAKKMATLRARAEGGDAKAKSVIEKDTRVKGGKWVGDVREVISTCNGSFTTDNKNVRKFKDAGIVFRQYPLEPDKNDKVYLMLYPSKQGVKVDKAIATVFGKK